MQLVKGAGAGGTTDGAQDNQDIRIGKTIDQNRIFPGNGLLQPDLSLRLQLLHHLREKSDDQLIGGKLSLCHHLRVDFGIWVAVKLQNRVSCFCHFLLPPLSLASLWVNFCYYSKIHRWCQEKEGEHPA